MVLKDMTFYMKKKFDTYGSEYNVRLAIMIILDPWAKFTILKCSYSKIDPYGFKEV